jgi:hypothetical protein
LKSLNHILSWLIWATLLPPLVLGPWLFAAWEGWWFWPFAACIALGSALGGLRWALSLESPSLPHALRSYLWTAVGAIAIALGYLTIRAIQTPVLYDAQRHLLLFVLPLAVGLLTIFGMGPRQRRALWAVMMLNLALLACYGLVNHAWTGSEIVLWRAGYA